MTMSLTAEQMAVLMSLPQVKKRRGRPPKYLNIWKQEYILNMAAKLQEKAQKMAHEEAAMDGTNVLNSVGPTREETNELTHEKTTDEIICEVKRERLPALIVDQQLIVAKMGSQERQLSDSIYTNPGVFCNSDGSVVSQPSGYLSAENIPTGSAMPASRSPPPLLQPMKRRPGRPPGSTKKAKMLLQQQRQMQHPQQQLQLQQQLSHQSVCVKPVPLRRDSSTDGDFTLRKFFEAGGRDYNDYLGWLKRKSIERSELETSPFQVYQGCPSPCSPPQFVTRMPYPPQSPVLISPPSPANGFLPPVYPTYYNGGQLSPPSLVNLVASTGQAATNSRCTLHIPNQTTFSGDALDLSAKTRIDNEECETEESHKRMRLMTTCPYTDGTMDIQIMPAEYDKVESSTDSDIRSWDVDHVVKFVLSVPGCEDYAELFREHRIDGSTLPHLSESHLLNVVNMKLGPAIKLMLAVEHLRGNANS